MVFESNQPKNKKKEIKKINKRVHIFATFKFWYWREKWLVADVHGFHTALYISVKAKENEEKLPTFYKLPKLHKNLQRKIYCQF